MRKQIAQKPECNPEIFQEIIRRIYESGNDLLAVVKADDSLPPSWKIYRWLDENPEYRRDLAIAREALGDRFAAEIRDIPRETTNENVAVQRVRFEALRWLAPRFNARYVDKSTSELTGKGGGAVQVQPVPLNLEALSEEQLDALRDAMAKQLPSPQRG